VASAISAIVEKKKKRKKGKKKEGRRGEASLNSLPISSHFVLYGARPSSKKKEGRIESGSFILAAF